MSTPHQPTPSWQPQTGPAGYQRMSPPHAAQPDRPQHGFSPGAQWLATGLFAILQWLIAIMTSTLVVVVGMSLIPGSSPSADGYISGLVTSITQYPLPLLVHLGLTAVIYWFFVFGPPRWNTFGLQLGMGIVAALIADLVDFVAFTVPTVFRFTQDFTAALTALTPQFFAVPIYSIFSASLAALIVGFIFRPRWRSRQATALPPYRQLPNTGYNSTPRR
ncbi:hypothetical protein [Micrococcoides hystricis]|uniref:Uncharacterized protein n=1 Tax=Micrococcoides hystricis TaxID=1572761 RepID=A0ABV6P957_9MICC